MFEKNQRYTKKLEIQLFRERLSGKVDATILKDIVGGFQFSFFQRNLKELARKAMEMCLRVLKESNKSKFDSYSCQEQCIDHIPYYLSGLSRAHFFRQPFSKQLYTKKLQKKVALIQVVRKRVSFQDSKNENTPKFLSIKI